MRINRTWLLTIAALIILIIGCVPKLNHPKVSKHPKIQTLYGAVTEDNTIIFLANFNNNFIKLPNCLNNDTISIESLNNLFYKNNFKECNELLNTIDKEIGGLLFNYPQEKALFHVGRVDLNSKGLDANAFFLYDREINNYAKGYPYKAMILLISKNDTIKSGIQYTESMGLYSHNGVSVHTQKSTFLNNNYFYVEQYMNDEGIDPKERHTFITFGFFKLDSLGYFNLIREETEMDGIKFPRPLYLYENDSIIFVK